MYYIKSNRNYYYKIYKNNKKIRISKDEYKKNILKGGQDPDPYRLSPVTTTATFNQLDVNELNTKIKNLYKNKNSLKNISNKILNNFNKNIKNNDNNIFQPKKKQKINNLNNISLTNLNKIKNYKRGTIITQIYNNKKNNQIIKKFTFTFSKSQIKDCIDVLNEIIMQKYALELTTKYNETHDFKFKVPEIYNINYKLNKNNDTITITIKMEKLNQSKDNKCLQLNSTIYNEIKNYLSYLRDNHLFHNDTHNENLFFIDDPEYEMGLIDFGKAKTDINHPSTSGIKKMNNNEKNNRDKSNFIRKWYKCNNTNKFADYY